MAKSEPPLNPFLFGKIEQEPSPILYVPDSIFDWASGRPMRFEGLRGSGKSSTLLSLTWKVAWQAPSIKVTGSSVIDQFFKNPTHIGVYHRVEDMDIPYWDRWSVSPDMAQRYFGTYLDFLYLDLLLDAVDGIRQKDKNLFSERDAEINLVSALLAECFPDKTTRPKLLEESFSSLREVVADVHRGIRHLVFQNVTEQIMKDTYSVVGAGTLVKEFGNAFINYYPKMSDWTILILLDDCNFLTKWQTVIVNTAIANCSHPIVYKLSSLAGLYPTLETMENQRPVILDNIETVLLPGRSPYIASGESRSRRDIKYETFVNGVCKARIEKYYGKLFADKFDFKELLGPFNLEELLAKKLRDSENEEVINLLNLAKKIGGGSKPPPITGSWLSQKKVREETIDTDKNHDEIKRRTRQIASVYKKKWNHVAGISLCKEFRLEFPYCGSRVVLHLSAGSIREVLRIMSMIWEETGYTIDRFVEQKPIDQTTQTNGIKMAASTTYTLIDANPISRVGPTLQGICLRLGNLFSKCQSYPYILTAPETAAIRTTRDAINSDIEDIIRKALVSGWLLKKETKDNISIGLHPILAPKFGISFRNPFYYPEPVSSGQFQTLFLGNNEKAARTENSILEARMKRYTRKHKSQKESPQAKDEKQMDMFEGDFK